jgi:hypothetical protein
MTQLGLCWHHKNRKHRVAIHFVEVDVLQHSAVAVREVEKIHASLVGIHAGFDRNTLMPPSLITWLTVMLVNVVSLPCQCFAARQ